MTRGEGKAVAALLVLATTAGCAPALLWYGHDPARRTRWELRAADGQSWLESPASSDAKGRRGNRYDQILVAAMTFDPLGRRFAVPARRGASWFMLVDGGDATAKIVEGPAWDGVAAPLFSPDGRHLAYAAERGGRWTVVHDGKPGLAVDAVIDGAIAFSPSGRRLGYAAGAGGCVRVFTDEDRPRGCYQDVRALFMGERAEQDVFVVKVGGVVAVVRDESARVVEGFSQVVFDPPRGRWAAAARTADRTRVVVEGETTAEADEIASLSFSPAGELAYAARQGDAWHLIVGDKRAGPYRWIRAVAFSGTGRRHGYVAGLPDGREAVVIDGSLHAAWSSVDGVVFSPDDRRVAYAVRGGNQAAIACDNRVFPFDVVVESSIAFSADGRHWGALVGDSRRRLLTIVVDGQEHLPFDSTELFGAAAQQAGDASGLRRWIKAELERHLHARKRS